MSVVLFDTNVETRRVHQSSVTSTNRDVTEGMDCSVDDSLFAPHAQRAPVMKRRRRTR